MSNTPTPTISQSFESDIIAELERRLAEPDSPPDTFPHGVYADWLESECDGQEELAGLVRWMGDKGHWPVYSQGKWFFWLESWTGTQVSRTAWPDCCNLPDVLFLFIEKKFFDLFYCMSDTLLSALKNYYQAWQARQLMEDGSNFALVPASVAVCPECGGQACVEANEWRAEGEHDGMPTEAGLNVGCGDDVVEMLFGDNGHCYWQSSWQPVRNAVARWCRAVD